MALLKNLLSVDQLTDEVLMRLFASATSFQAMDRERMRDLLRGRVMASMFWQESTRTRLSHEAAMLRMGGSVVGTENARAFSSVAKGEDNFDMGLAIGIYADIIVARHMTKGGVAELARDAVTPVINGGDGPGDHPTQALGDMLHIFQHHGTLDNLTVVMAGDCKRSRTIHPDVRILMRHGCSFIFVSRPTLRIPDDLRAELDALKCKYSEQTALNRDIMRVADVMYMTRDQDNLTGGNGNADYTTGDPVVLTPDLLDIAKPSLLVQHPLPRRTEIDRRCDDHEIIPVRKHLRDQMDACFWGRHALIAELMRLDL